MIEGQLVFSGFQFALGDAKAADGSQKKAIVFQPAGTKTSFVFIFEAAELQKFIQIISDSYIVPAHEMPRSNIINL